MHNKSLCNKKITEKEKDSVITLYDDSGNPIKEIIWGNGNYYTDEPLDYKHDYKALEELTFTDLAIKTLVKYKVTMSEACDLMRMFEGECGDDDRITLKMLLAKGIDFKTHRRYFPKYGFVSDNYNMEIGDPIDA